MAHAALHFALGMTVGMAVTAPRLRRAWQAGEAIAPAMLRSLVASWTLGVIAIVPSLLRYAGIPASFCGGWWMNVFMLHPLLNACLPQSTLAGSAAFMGVFIAQYLGLLTAIVRVRRGL
jgi:hypothetical protein